MTLSTHKFVFYALAIYWILCLHPTSSSAKDRVIFSTIPREFFESARIDGASEFQIYGRIVLPLSLPILTTVAIINFHAIYNDFIWPLMVIQHQDLKTFAVAIFDLSTVYRFEYGMTFAAYVIGSLPLVIALLAGMKYFIRGITEGGLKA